VHTPLWQVSVWVQALPSSQVLSLAFAGFEHVPVAGSQVPAVWHWSEAVQTTALPVHTPLWQVSVCVHALPSLQVLPLAFAGFEHVPVAGSQVPAVWHWSEAAQATGLLPVQTPLLQVSVCVQALPSSQGAVLSVWTQPLVGSQLSSVQTSWSSQSSGVPLTQVWFTQVSRPSQMLPLSQSPSLVQQPGMGSFTHPKAGSQKSFVQGAPSLQVSGVPG